MKKRITAALLAVCMVVSMVHLNATTSIDDSIITTESTELDDTSEESAETSSVNTEENSDVLNEETMKDNTSESYEVDESESINETIDEESSSNSPESQETEDSTEESIEESTEESIEESTQDDEIFEELDYETSVKVEKDLEEMEENKTILEHGGEIEENAISAPEQQLYSILRSARSTNGISVTLYDSTVGNGSTPLNSIDWNAVDGTDSANGRIIKTKININGNNGYLDSKRGEIKIEIPNMLYGVKADESARKNWNNAYMDVQIGIDSSNSWYCENAQNDLMSNKTFIFKNSDLIKSGASIVDSITITYTIKPISMIDNMDEVTKRWRNYGEATRNLESSIQATMEIIGPMVQSERQTVTSPNWPNNYPQFAECIPWNGAAKVRYLMWKGEFGTDNRKPKYLAFFLDNSSALAWDDSLFFDHFSGADGYDIYGNKTHYERPLQANPPYNIGGGKSFIMEDSAYWIGMYGWQGGAKGFKVDIYPIYIDTYTSDAVQFNYQMKHELILQEEELNKLVPIKSASTKDFIKMNLFDYKAISDEINVDKKHVENSKYPRFQNEGAYIVMSYDDEEFMNYLGKYISTDFLVKKPAGNSSTILKSDLGSDGFPELSNGNSLGYLFGSENLDYVEKVNDDNIDGLYLYDSYTDTYYYDSNKNAAQWNEEIGSINLYDKAITYDSMYSDGGFFPFNDINKAINTMKFSRSYYCQQAAIALAKSKEDGISEKEKKQYENFSNKVILWVEKIDKQLNNSYSWDYTVPDSRKDLYQINLSDKTNFHTGLQQEFAFYQPVDGIVETESGNNPMKFEYKGTNDCFVYIDDKLVFQKTDSVYDEKYVIDFAEGNVKQYRQNDIDCDKTTSFSDIFDSKDLNENGTFKDYSVHSIKIFTYDRVAISILRMNFNLQMIQNDIGADGIIVNGVVKWDKEPEDINSIQINICRRIENGEDEIFETVEAKKENGWKYALLCPGKDEGGNEYVYWVEEKTDLGDDYVVMYFDRDTDFVNNPEDWYYNIYNAKNLQMDEIKGIVQWSQQPDGIDSIRLEIHQVSHDGTDKIYATVSTTAKKDWTWALTVPQIDIDDNPYSYYVKCPIGGTYESWYYADNIDEKTKETAIGKLNVFNRLLELTGEITWNEIPSGINSIEIEILKTDADNITETYEKVTVNKKDNWKWSLFVPVVDDKNREYSYSVKHDSDMCLVSYYKDDKNSLVKESTKNYLNVYNESLKIEGKITWSEIPDIILNSIKTKTIKEETIKSPYWPDKYSNNTNQEWIFTKDNADFIEITFDKSSELEIYNDYITFFDENGRDITKSVCGSAKLYGTDMAGKTYTIDGNYLKIKMYSDMSVTKKGFSAKICAKKNVEQSVNVSIIQTDSQGNDKVYKTFNLLGDDNWQYETFVPVAQNNGHGDRYSYRVEHDSELCEVFYYDNDINNKTKSSKNGFYNIFNKSLKLTGEVTWNEIPDNVNFIEILIEQKNPETNEILSDEKNMKVEASRANNWKWSEFVPAATNKGHGEPYVYRVKELNDEMYGVTYFDESIDNGSKEPIWNALNIQNLTKKVSGKISFDIEPFELESIDVQIFQVNKEISGDEPWNNTGEQPENPGESSEEGGDVIVEPEEGTEEPGESADGTEESDGVGEEIDTPQVGATGGNLYKIVTVKKEDDWTYSLYVPYEDNDDNRYYYYVKEVDSLTHHVKYHDDITEPENGFDGPGTGLYNIYNYDAGYWTSKTDIRIQKRWLFKAPIASVELELRKTNLSGTIDEHVKDVIIESNGTRNWEIVETVDEFEKYNTPWRYYVVEKTDNEGQWGTYYKNEFNGMTSPDPKAGYLIVYNYKIAKIKGNTSRLKISKILLNDEGNKLSEEDWERMKLESTSEKDWLAYFEITNAEHPELKYTVTVNVLEGTVIKFLPAGGYYIRELGDTWQILELMASNKNDAGEFNYDPDSKTAYFTIK